MIVSVTRRNGTRSYTTGIAHCWSSQKFTVNFPVPFVIFDRDSKFSRVIIVWTHRSTIISYGSYRHTHKHKPYISGHRAGLVAGLSLELEALV
jgi:hypothetical protein